MIASRRFRGKQMNGKNANLPISRCRLAHTTFAMRMRSDGNMRAYVFVRRPQIHDEAMAIVRVLVLQLLLGLGIGYVSAIQGKNA